MTITQINDIPINDYPIVEAMIANTLVRFSRWECAKYFEKRGRNYTETMGIYDRHIKNVDKILHNGKELCVVCMENELIKEEVE